jgi:transglutaminase-like putative cysteine protease
VYFPTQQIAVDRENSLRSPVGLAPEFTYTVISEVPERSVKLLQTAGKQYNAEFQQSLPDYLQIPAQLAQRLRPFTEKIIAEYTQTQISKNPTPLDNQYDIALYLAQYLKQNYQLPSDPLALPPVPAGQDLTDWFLFRCQSGRPDCTAGGYPDHFATTYTMMLRSIGIPARLAVGFQPGSFNPFTGMYEVKNTDAHALTEVYFPQYGWYSFDPIPTHPLFPPSIEDDQTFGLLTAIWKWVAGLLPSPVTAWLAAVWGALMWGIVWMWSWETGSWLGTVVALALALASTFGLWLLWQNWQRWRYQHWLSKQPPMEQIYQQFLLCCDRTIPRQPHQTPTEHLAAIQSDPALLATAQPVVAAYVAWRYGNQPPALDYLRSLLRDLHRARL